jgi:hypothetical protein
MKNIGIIVSLVTVAAVTAALLQVQKNDREEVATLTRSNDYILMMLVQKAALNHPDARRPARQETPVTAPTNAPVALK